MYLIYIFACIQDAVVQDLFKQFCYKQTLYILSNRFNCKIMMNNIGLGINSNWGLRIQTLVISYMLATGDNNGRTCVVTRRAVLETTKKNITLTLTQGVI